MEQQQSAVSPFHAEPKRINVEAGKSLTFSVDGGNGIVIGRNVIVAEDSIFEGGDGVDSIEDDGIVGGEKKEIKEFEIIV